MKDKNILKKEYRFIFHPFNKKFFDCEESHVIKIQNLKHVRFFDEYIRGIIQGKTLYLRLYYPFEDINEKNYNELLIASNKLLKHYENEVLKAIKKEYSLDIKTIKYSITNNDLKGLVINI